MHILYSASPRGGFLLLSHCANSLWFVAAEISFVNISIPCLDLLQSLKIIIMFSFFNNAGPVTSLLSLILAAAKGFPSPRAGNLGQSGVCTDIPQPRENRTSVSSTEPLWPQQNPYFPNRIPFSSTEPLFFQQNLSFLNRTSLSSAESLFSQQNPIFLNRTPLSSTEPLFLQQSPFFLNRTLVFSTGPLFSQQNPSFLHKTPFFSAELLFSQ